MDPRDQVLQASAPTMMVPRFSPFEPLQTIGHRFLVAADGMWLELRRAWLYLRLPLAEQTMVAMPYGSVTPETEIVFGKVPRSLLDEFVEQAKACFPDETAAWIVWNEKTGAMRLLPLAATSASTAHVNYECQRLEEGEHAVIDLHSHGKHKAFFSRMDNADDRGDVKLAGVVGNLDQPEHTFAFRLCALGLFIKL